MSLIEICFGISSKNCSAASLRDPFFDLRNCLAPLGLYEETLGYRVISGFGVHARF